MDLAILVQRVEINEVMDEFLLTSELDTCVDSFIDTRKNVFVLTVRLVIFSNKRENVININFGLAYELNFEY